MKPVISSHHSNDDQRLYSFQRRSFPPYYPEPAGWTPDAIVVVFSLVCAVLALALSWYYTL